MKILIVLKRWVGGVGVVVKNIKKELEKMGHDITIISREDDLAIGFFGSLFKIRNLINRIGGKYDIIYTQDWSIALPLLYPYEIFKKNHFCCFHGNQPGKTKFLQDIIGKKLGKRLIVVGDSLKHRFPKSNLIYNGIDLNQFKPLNKKREFLGWIDKSTEKISKEDLIDLSNKIGLPPLIIKKFSIPFENMNEDFYNKCKIFVSLPPKSAGFNLCWTEAMAAGVPIIIGNGEGIGCKLPIEKVDDLKNLSKTILKTKDKNYREWLKNNNFSWKRNVEGLLKLWEIK
jgi:glycosyltransferase involved in cell wall biosynthesis